METEDTTKNRIKDIRLLTKAEIAKFSVVQCLEHMRAVKTDVLLELREIQAAPDGRKHPLMWTTGDAGPLLGRSQTYLNRLPEEHLKPPMVKEYARYYGPEHLYAIRRAKQLAPYRPDSARVTIIGVAMQKGGVAKTTTSLTLTHYLATRGYRVLLVDIDSQASNTTAFEIYDDNGVLQPCGKFLPTYEQTVAAVMTGDASADIREVIRKTHWPTVDIIPSSPNLARGEMDLVVALLGDDRRQRSRTLTSLKRGLESAATLGYDVIIVDTPPGVSVTKVAVDIGVDGLVIPSPMRPIDTHSLFAWSDTTLDWFAEFGTATFDNLKWFRILPTMYKGTSRDESRVHLELKDNLGEVVLPAIPFLEAIKKGGGSSPTVYERADKASDKTAAKQARERLNEAYSEILELIAEGWEQ